MKKELVGFQLHSAECRNFSPRRLGEAKRPLLAFIYNANADANAQPLRIFKPYSLPHIPGQSATCNWVRSQSSLASFLKTCLMPNRFPCFLSGCTFNSNQPKVAQESFLMSQTTRGGPSAVFVNTSVQGNFRSNRHMHFCQLTFTETG